MEQNISSRSTARRCSCSPVVLISLAGFLLVAHTANGMRVGSEQQNKSLLQTRDGTVSGQTAKCPADGSAQLDLTLSPEEAANHITLICPANAPEGDYTIKSAIVPSTPGAYCRSGTISDCEEPTKQAMLTNIFPAYNATWQVIDPENPHSMTLTVPVHGFPQSHSNFTIGCHTSVSRSDAARETSAEFYDCDVRVEVKGRSGAASLIGTGALGTSLLFVVVSTYAST